MTTASDLIDEAKSLVSGETLKFDKKLYESARSALAQLIVVEANEMDTTGSNEEMSIAHLLSAVHHLFAWYEGEEAEGEVMEETIEMSASTEKKMDKAMCKVCDKAEDACNCEGGFKAADDEETEKAAHKEMKPNKGETENEFKARCKEAGMEDDAIKGMCGKYFGAEAEKSAENKCLECGCHTPEESHGRTDVSTADMVSPADTPKSAESADTEEEETKDSTTESVEDEVKAIVEEAVKSATKSLTAEIANLIAAKEAASDKAVGLETELAVAKSLAVAGGPKRTIRPVDHASTDLLVKAATYKAKADATTDPDLAKGYKALYQEFLGKASALNESN